jgi:hypothetical protein
VEDQQSPSESKISHLVNHMTAMESKYKAKIKKLEMKIERLESELSSFRIKNDKLLRDSNKAPSVISPIAETLENQSAREIVNEYNDNEKVKQLTNELTYAWSKIKIDINKYNNNKKVHMITTDEYGVSKLIEKDLETTISTIDKTNDKVVTPLNSAQLCVEADTYSNQEQVSRTEEDDDRGKSLDYTLHEVVQRAQDLNLVQEIDAAIEEETKQPTKIDQAKQQQAKINFMLKNPSHPITSIENEYNKLLQLTRKPSTDTTVTTSSVSSKKNNRKKNNKLNKKIKDGLSNLNLDFQMIHDYPNRIVQIATTMMEDLKEPQDYDEMNLKQYLRSTIKSCDVTKIDKDKETPHDKRTNEELLNEILG